MALRLGPKGPISCLESFKTDSYCLRSVPCEESLRARNLGDHHTNSEGWGKAKIWGKAPEEAHTNTHVKI